MPDECSRSFEEFVVRSATDLNTYEGPFRPFHNAAHDCVRKNLRKLVVRESTLTPITSKEWSSLEGPELHGAYSSGAFVSEATSRNEGPRVSRVETRIIQ
jgi:hypothetical protein